MADDVKVKFGGDFSGIADGAAAAGKIAGTAISASFKAYTASLTSSIANMFSVTNIMGKLFESVKNGLTYFREIDELSRQLNVSREDLQKFGKLGKEVGISMETMGRSIQFANKTIGAAMIANGSQRQTLQALGYTEEQITSGKVKSLDVMMKLAGEYDKQIDRNVIAKHTTDMFGRSGAELNKILSDGTKLLKERIDAMHVYSDAEVKAAANADRAAEAAAKLVADTGRGLAVGAGESITRVMVSDALRKTGILSQEQRAENPGSFELQVNRFKEELNAFGGKVKVTPEAAANELTRRVESGFILNEKTLDYISALAAALRAGLEKPKASEENAANPQLGAAALATSSLQAIGGGDLGAIMSGFHVDVQQEQLDVQKQIATNTTPAPAGSAKTIVNVAK